MQIEESFRDMKSARFGLALEFHRSRDPQRLAILLLILALALLVLWLIGSIAKARGLMRHYQANTVRHREVLSVIFLGIRIIKRAQDHFTTTELCIAWQSIPLRNARVPTLITTVLGANISWGSLRDRPGTDHDIFVYASQQVR